MSEIHDTGTAARVNPEATGLPVLPTGTAVLEIMLLIVLPGVLDYFVPAFPSLNDGHPHFFWLPVLLLSIQYGPVSGLLAAGTAIATSAFLGWPEQEIGENHFSFLLRIWLQPGLWLAAAIILGQFRLRQIERKESLSHAVTELTVQRHALADHVRNLRRRCEALERTIAIRPEPDARKLLAALGRLQSPDTPLAAVAFQETVTLGFGECSLSVWLRDADGLRLIDRHGARPDTHEREHIGPTEPINVSVVQHGRRLSVLNPGDERELAGHGIAAAPILSPDNAVVGMLLLELAAPDELDTTTTLRLAAIARIVGHRLQVGQSPQRPVAVRPAPEPIRTGRMTWRHARWRDGKPTRAASRTR